ncbi:MAG TPA: DUF3800 domain-containing protein [Candidatus Paceibacterota bacterium]|nr:DUF3800 domain-containing protein [Candidatus Paceibacterota bacterium]
MFYIFLDESGDLGFGNKSSRWFILTMVLTGNHRKVEKCVKRVHHNLKKKYKRVAELHAYHADEITRKRILQLLSETEDLKILCIILNKKKVHTDLQGQKNLLYNYTANILLDRLANKKVYNTHDKIQIYIDQRETNKFLNENFKNYLNRNLVRKGSNNFEIKIRPSQAEKCLQAVDFISWAIFRKYEKNDYEYYETIKNKIIEENLLFP